MLHGMLRVMAFLLLALVTATVVFFASHGNLLLGGIVGLIIASFGSAKEILEPIKQAYEIRKLRLEISEKKRQQEQEQSRIVLPTPQEIKDLGTPYRVIERDILAPYSQSKNIVPVKNFISQTKETRIDELADIQRVYPKFYRSRGPVGGLPESF